MTVYFSIFTSQFKTFVDSICMQCLQMVQEQLYSFPENFDHVKHLNIDFMSALFLFSVPVNSQFESRFQLF